MVQMFGSLGGQKKVEREGVYWKRVIGTIEQYSDAAAAQQLAARIIARPKSLVSRPAPPMTIAELCEHFQQRELSQSDAFRSHSTRRNYIFYLNKWIIPRWKDYELAGSLWCSAGNGDADVGRSSRHYQQVITIFALQAPD